MIATMSNAIEAVSALVAISFVRSGMLANCSRFIGQSYPWRPSESAPLRRIGLIPLGLDKGDPN